VEGPESRSINLQKWRSALVAFLQLKILIYWNVDQIALVPAYTTCIKVSSHPQRLKNQDTIQDQNGYR
jgi:hypothetical protein